MKAIIESGATKSDWRFVDRSGVEVSRFLSTGINVSSMKMEAVKQTLANGFAQNNIKELDGFYLYSAGVFTDAIREDLTRFITGSINVGDIDIQDDLVGAARSVFGHGSGVVAIMGTGSNSCFYDGKNVFRKVKSGGFILGDEGSGATLGKLFIADFLKDLVPDDIAKDFSEKFDSSYAGIVENVYRGTSPSGYLGSLAPFILSHYGNPYIKNLVDGNFRAFIQRSLLKYDSRTIGIVGGFGNACKDIFLPLCEEAGITVAGFVPSPIENLIKFHSN